MTLQKITTPGGETLVVLPEDEYDKLIDAADIASAERVRRDIETGADEMIPAEFANRILDGESPVPVWRDFRGLPAKDLASAANISAGYLSEIEAGKKAGTVSTLKAIAGVLEIDLDDLA